MKTFRLLDLFCGAGGCSVGYHRVGFEVVGVDINPQKNYPFEFHQADAMTYPLNGFDAIHTSPPCQAYTIAGYNERKNGRIYPDLVNAIRQRLIENKKPWIIENVPGSPLARGSLILCGSQFGLPIARHRIFETSFGLLNGLPSCRHAENLITICGNGTPQWIRKARMAKGLHPDVSIATKRAAMGIDWMTRKELSQAIPPVYTEWLGKQLIKILEDS